MYFNSIIVCYKTTYLYIYFELLAINYKLLISYKLIQKNEVWYFFKRNFNHRCTLLLEAVSFAGKGDLVLTGQMGDVMKESAEIAFNVAKKIAVEKKIKKPDWFEKNTVHLHIPEGATPKDGPSAGITMLTVFSSLFSGKIIKKSLAMTGELSLTGKVLPIGGLREKTVAARRNGVKTIFIPKSNERDLEEIPEIVKTGIKFIPVKKAF